MKMNEHLKTILYAASFAIAALLLANCVYFIIELIKNGIGESWSFRFEKGMFYKNNEPLGVAFGSSKGNGLMLFAFIYGLYRAFRKGRLRF